MTELDLIDIRLKCLEILVQSGNVMESIWTAEELIEKCREIEKYVMEPEYVRSK